MSSATFCKEILPPLCMRVSRLYTI